MASETVVDRLLPTAQHPRHHSMGLRKWGASSSNTPPRCGERSTPHSGPRSPARCSPKSTDRGRHRAIYATSSSSSMAGAGGV